MLVVVHYIPILFEKPNPPSYLHIGYPIDPANLVRDHV